CSPLHGHDDAHRGHDPHDRDDAHALHGHGRDDGHDHSNGHALLLHEKGRSSFLRSYPGSSVHPDLPPVL
ncbi:hypothetical protein LIR42_10605, partial [Faecalicatena fissicatena]|nr:hypothetical protein [Faecalicatena fissicatena]